MLEKILEVKNVAKDIVDKKILENIFFTIYKGQITTLIGQNGSGKTTLARILVGIDKDFKGSVSRFTEKIAYIPQKINFNKNIPMRASYLISILSERKIFNNSSQLIDLMKFTTVNNLHNFVNIANIISKDISQLSEGEMQKILIISILSRDAELFILDEPNQYLDLQSQKFLYKILKDLAHNAQKSILIISHDLFTVMKHSDHVICLNKHICCSGKVKDFYVNKDLSDALSEVGLYIHDHDHTHL